MRRSKAVWWAILLLVMTGAAHASIVEWDLHDVVFDDGGKATGSFTWVHRYPFSPGGVWSMDMQTSGGTLHPTRYARGTADGFARGDLILFCNPYEATWAKQCLLFTVPVRGDSMLPDEGGVVPLSGCWATTALCVLLNERSSYSGFPRQAIAGELIGTVIPELTPVWYLGLGLLIISLIERWRPSPKPGTAIG